MLFDCPLLRGLIGEMSIWHQKKNVRYNELRAIKCPLSRGFLMRV